MNSFFDAGQLNIQSRLAARRKQIAVFFMLFSGIFIIALGVNLNSADSAALTAPGLTALVSSNSSGTIGNGSSDVDLSQPVISANSQFTVFTSQARNLVSGDTNATADIFKKDNTSGQTTRVSTTAAGAQASGVSERPSVSADGRYIAFQSTAANLVTGDTNAWQDSFVKDTQTGAVTRISTDSNGAQVFGDSSRPAISQDGRYVAFISTAPTLVAGDTNGQYDVFVKDIQTGKTTRISTDSAGNQANSQSDYPTISANGRYVAFRSLASNLVTGDTNGKWDIFVKDTQTGTTTCFSKVGAVFGNGDSGWPSISADGNYVAFPSAANNLVSGDTNSQNDIFRASVQTGQIIRVDTTSTGGQVTGACDAPVLSSDGRFVAFQSVAKNLVSGDTNSLRDIFRKDTQTGQVLRYSSSTSGTASNGHSDFPAISASGSYIAFVSAGTNLVTGDTNAKSDVFIASKEPAVTSILPAGSINSTSTTISAGYSAASGIKTSSVKVLLDGVTRTGCTVTAANVSCSVTGMSQGTHNITVNLTDNAGNTGSGSGSFTVDSVAPAVSGVLPSGTVSGNSTTISVAYSDSGTGINTSLVSVYLDGIILGGCTVNTGNTDCPVSGMAPGTRSITGSVSDNAGNTSPITGSFNVASQSSGFTSLASSDAAGNIGNAASYADWSQPTISADGRFTFFTSLATNLVSGDNNGFFDIFKKDNGSGQISIVTASASGALANNISLRPSVSADGRYVVFQSIASNLVAGDTNDWQDCFMKDTLTGTVTLVSTDSSGNQVFGDSSRPVISQDGRYVAFISTAGSLAPGGTDGRYDVYVKNVLTGSTTRVSTDSSGNEANSASDYPSISGDGRYVAFRSPASNLVSGDSNGRWDIFVKNTQTGAINCLSKLGGVFGNGDSDWPSISADGNFVAFPSSASNLISGDTNNQTDIFRASTQTGAITRVNTNASGAQATDYSDAPVISADGRYIAFHSWASNLVGDDTNNTSDIFRKDLQTGEVVRFSTDSAGAESNGGSESPAITADGSRIAFESAGNNLVSGDANGTWDVFIRTYGNTSAAAFNMQVADGGRGDVTMSINWQAGFDLNLNATAKVMYRLYPDTPYVGNQPEYTEQFIAHTGSQNSVALSGLKLGRFYDFRVEVIDPDGVIGQTAQEDTGRLLRDDRFQFNVVARNTHSVGAFDEVQVRDIVNGKLYWGTNMNWWPDTISNMSQAYESTLFNGNVSEYAVPGGKAAWQSVVDRARGKVYIAGEMPRTADSLDGLHYRSMIGVITEETNPTLNTYLVPGTDDVNELIGFCMDTAGNRLIAGERGPGTPLADTNPGWSSGGGLWSIPIATINDPSTYQRIYQLPDVINRYWLHLMVFNGRLYAQMKENGAVISAPLNRVGPGMQDSDWTTEFPDHVTAMIVSRNQSKLYLATDEHIDQGYYTTIYTNNGSGWNSGVGTKAWTPWSMFELSDGRLLQLNWSDEFSHSAFVSDPVTGDFEYIRGLTKDTGIPGVGMGGGGANYNFAYDGNDIYYGTCTNGCTNCGGASVIKATYTP